MGSAAQNSYENQPDHHIHGMVITMIIMIIMIIMLIMIIVITANHGGQPNSSSEFS